MVRELVGFVLIEMVGFVLVEMVGFVLVFVPTCSSFSSPGFSCCKGMSDTFVTCWFGWSSLISMLVKSLRWAKAKGWENVYCLVSLLLFVRHSDFVKMLRLVGRIDFLSLIVVTICAG